MNSWTAAGPLDNNDTANRFVGVQQARGGPPCPPHAVSIAR
jgi:hypothetical protein